MPNEEIKELMERIEDLCKKSNIEITLVEPLLNFTELEECILASYDFESNNFIGISSPVTEKWVSEKQKHSFKIKKGRGHNKLQKRKKK